MKRLVLLCSMLVGFAAHAQDLPKPVDYTDVRGSIVFRTYCALCHGYKADGNGRAARNYSPRPANLVMSTATDEYMALIIRKGGVGVGRSQFMPPWGDELTDEQIVDVIYFLSTTRANRPSDVAR